MDKILECLPNFSEGRDQAKLDAIIGEITKVPGVELWFNEADKDYNRVDVCFIGSPEAVKTAMINSALKAAELIDMSTQHGVHPRVGAVDTVPFIPIYGMTVEETVEIANEVAKTISEKLNCPVYLYADAATSPDRPTQRDIQSTQYERLFERIKEPDFGPDYGPREVSVKHGATMVGVRKQYVSMNYTLDSEDLSVAKNIAKNIRESSGGGLKNIKSIGVQLESGKVQVSIDNTNYEKTQIFKQYELVKAMADQFGTRIIGTEIIGMMPEDALIDYAIRSLKINNYNPEMIVEKRVLDYVLKNSEK